MAGDERDEVEHPSAHGLFPGCDKNMLHQVRPESGASRDSRSHHRPSSELLAIAFDLLLITLRSAPIKTKYR